MDRVMVERWQTRVAPNDLIYHLGDVGMTKGDYLDKIIAQLPGRKVLILGNHDKSATRMAEMGFDVVAEAMLIVFNGMTLYLNHRPLPVLPNVTDVKHYLNGVDFVLHGHIHNSTREDRHQGNNELLDIPSFNINLSVEMTNYEPVSLSALVKRLRMGSKTPMDVVAPPSSWGLKDGQPSEDF